MIFHGLAMSHVRSPISDSGHRVKGNPKGKSKIHAKLASCTERHCYGRSRPTRVYTPPLTAPRRTVLAGARGTFPGRF